MKRINLIAGPNNVGKTSILEALWISQGVASPDIVFRANDFRGFRAFAPMRPLEEAFNRFEYNIPIELIGRTTEGREISCVLQPVMRRTAMSTRTITLSSEEPEKTVSFSGSIPSSAVGPIEYDIKIIYTDSALEQQFESRITAIDGRLNYEREETIRLPTAIFVHSNRSFMPEDEARRFSSMELAGEKKEIINALKIIEPRIRDINLVLLGNIPVVHTDVGIGRLTPLPLLGEGMNRLLTYVVDIGTSNQGMVMIDEIENGIHYSVMKEVWDTIGKLAIKNDVQVFATTHSEECVRSAYETFRNDDFSDDVFAFHRLFRKEEEIKCSTYDLEALGGALDVGMETR